MSSDQVREKQNEKTRKKGRGCMLTAAVLIFLTLAVPVVGYLVFSMRAARLVEDELDKIRAAGLPATPMDLDEYYEYPPADKDTTKLWIEAAKPFDFLNEQYNDDCGELPIVGCGVDEKPIPRPGQAWDELEAAEEFLAKYADSLDLMHQAAAKGGAARYPIDFSMGWAAEMSTTSELRDCARLLALQAHVRAHREDAHGAAESLHAILILSESQEKEPILVSQLIRLTLRSIACQQIGLLLPYVEFSDEDLAALREQLQNTDHDAALERAIIGERATGMEMFRNPTSVDDMKGSLAGRLGARNDDLLKFLELMNKFLAAAEKPYPQRLDEMEAVDDELSMLSRTLSPLTKFRYVMTICTTSYMGHVAEAFAVDEATRDAADAALAIEQFRRKHDRLPETLDELVPEFLDAVPIDPFDGKPLRYVVREDAYVIYSIGRDRADDGGEILDEVDEDGWEVENPDVIFPVKRVEK